MDKPKQLTDRALKAMRKYPPLRNYNDENNRLIEKRRASKIRREMYQPKSVDKPKSEEWDGSFD
jgi:hypothetical protein